MTTGTAWNFLVLSGAAVTIDLVEYHIEQVGTIMAILTQIVCTP